MWGSSGSLSAGWPRVRGKGRGLTLGYPAMVLEHLRAEQIERATMVAERPVVGEESVRIVFKAMLMSFTNNVDRSWEFELAGSRLVATEYRETTEFKGLGESAKTALEIELEVLGGVSPEQQWRIGARVSGRPETGRGRLSCLGIRRTDSCSLIGRSTGTSCSWHQFRSPRPMMTGPGEPGTERGVPVHQLRGIVVTNDPTRSS